MLTWSNGLQQFLDYNKLMCPIMPQEVISLHCRTKKVIHIKNVSRAEIVSSQTREFVATKQMVEELQNGIHGLGTMIY